jgi:1-acyl-sn-glycerol-3-phosphate acyltransferase
MLLETMKLRSAIHRLWYNLAKTMLQAGESVYFDLRYSGIDNIPATGAVLMVSNHQSHLDPPLIGSGCPRMMSYIARETLFRFRPFGWLIRSYNAISLDRDGTGLAGIKETLKRLKRGHIVLLFPEGTRSRDGKVGRFRPGFSTLALRSGAAILPTAIEGAYAAWPRGRRFPRPGPVRVHYGTPILPDEARRFDERELVEEIRRRVCYYHARLRQQTLD